MNSEPGKKSFLQKEHRKEVQRLKKQIRKLHDQIDARKTIRDKHIKEVKPRIQEFQSRVKNAKNMGPDEEWEARKPLFELIKIKFEEENQCWKQIQPLYKELREKERKIQEIQDTEIT